VSLNLIKLHSADGEFLERIPLSRLERLEGLNMIRRVIRNRHGVPKAATLWPRDSDNLLSHLRQTRYSSKKPIDKTSIYRIWKLLRIKKEDRQVFETSVTDNLVFVDPETKKKRRAA